MSNLRKIAPYVYLAKQSGAGTEYDLYLLVPEDARKTVNLNVQPVKGPGNRIFISYNSVEPAALEPMSGFKCKHWEIDSEGTYVDILIQGDNSEELSTLVAFADADPEPATSTNDKHTFAPYLYIGTEMDGEHFYFRPSNIVLFEVNTGAIGEGLTFSGSVSEHTLTPGDNGTIITNPENFAVNQSVRHEISGTTYTFGGTVNEYASLNKPIRKAKTKKIWITLASGNNSLDTVNSEELAGAKA